jgi:hypothetical protein
LSKVSGDNAPMVSNKQDRAVQICAPRSTAHIGFRTPLAFRSLSKGGGGVRNRGRTSPTIQISTPGSTVMKTIPDPPRPSTFKRRGGGGGCPESHMQLPDGSRSRRPDQRRSCSPALLSYLVINQCGPSSCHFILPSAFPLLPCVIHSPLLLGPRGSPFFPTSAHFLPRVPFLSTSVSHPKANPSPPVFLLHLMSSPP